MSDLQQCGILICKDPDKPVQYPLKLNDVQTEAELLQNIQATSKGFDQTARMHRLI